MVQRQLLAAVGFMELGMFQEAVEELESLPLEVRESTTVLAVWLEIYQSWQKWSEALAVASRLFEADPENPDWRIALAFATRRTRGLVFARELLLEAVSKFPKCAIIHFNLGCYAAQLGNLDEARACVDEAIRLDRQFEQLAKTDPDLAPLRAEFHGNGGKN
jgi:tetratricopeptide (TPR) repeat protein